MRILIDQKKKRKKVFHQTAILKYLFDFVSFDSFVVTFLIRNLTQTNNNVKNVDKQFFWQKLENKKIDAGIKLSFIFQLILD